MAYLGMGILLLPVICPIVRGETRYRRFRRAGMAPKLAMRWAMR